MMADLERMWYCYRDEVGYVVTTGQVKLARRGSLGCIHAHCGRWRRSPTSVMEALTPKPIAHIWYGGGRFSLGAAAALGPLSTVEDREQSVGSAVGLLTTSAAWNKRKVLYAGNEVAMKAYMEWRETKCTRSGLR
jgi:hypothetical protein